MSILSECLDYFVKKKEQNIAELAKKCRVDRSTMYQYIRGKRPLQNQELLETILAELRLTPEERSKAMQAFEVTQVGEEKYYRRKKVKELFASLLTLEESGARKLIEERDEKALKSSAVSVARTKENQMESIFGAKSEEIRMLNGEVEVQKGIHAILRSALEEGGPVNLFLQPGTMIFLYTINAIYECASASPIRHILCLNTNSAPMEYDTLDVVKSIMRCGVAIKEYSPYYYYGNTSEHYGMMNILPYFIVTDDCAVQIAVDGKIAIVHRKEQIHQYFKDSFSRMLQLCYPLMKSKVGLDRRLTWGMDYASAYHYERTIEVSSGLCSLQFWNRDLIETYLNPLIPGYKDLLEGLVRYTALLYEVKKKDQIVILMNSRYVLEFIQTGVFREYPEVFFVSPLEKKDRKYLLEQIFQAIEEGWYHIRLLEENEFPLDYRWETVSHQNGRLYMQYCIHDQFRIFELEIPEVTDAVYDYLQNLSESRTVMGEEASEELMRRWLKEYLE